MSEADEKASYVTLLEEELKRAEEELSFSRMEAEYEAVERDHELAWWMDWNRNLDEQGGFLETQLDVMEVEKDHEYALLEVAYEELQADYDAACITNHLGCIERWEKAIEDAISWKPALIRVVELYVAHFDRHPLNYMSTELNKITQQAREVLKR